jgi:tetratricopeptide (TPR) repeat protein
VANLDRFDEAVAEIKRALELDPLSVIINADVGSVLCTVRRYGEAIDQLRKTLEMDPGFYYAHWNLGVALELEGSPKEASAEYQKAVALSDDPLPLALLGHLYGRSGRKDEALKILAQLRESSLERYVSPYNLAIVQIGLGQNDEATRLLEKTYDDRDGYNIAFIKSDQLLDPLRGEPRLSISRPGILCGKSKSRALRHNAMKPKKFFAELKRRNGEHLFRGRDSGRNPDPAGKDRGSESDFAHFDAAVSESTGQSLRDRETPDVGPIGADPAFRKLCEEKLH